MACGRSAGTVDLALVPALTPNGRPAETGAVMTTALDDVPKKMNKGAEALRRRPAMPGTGPVAHGLDVPGARLYYQRQGSGR
jgi:hypothetical protein